MRAAAEKVEEEMKTVRIPRRSALALSASLTAIAVAGGANAQDQNSEDGLFIEEVVVTAQKRQQSVQDVPVSMTAFDAGFTKRVNLDDVKDLVKFSPGFAGNSKDSFIDYINIRGISTNDFGVGGDPSAGFFKNGLYQGRNGVAVTSMFDMERAEVLRGPQGFLFGRNAIAGAISLYTAKPSFDGTSGHVEVGVGERGIFEAEAAVNLPFSENVALRLAGYHSEENGYVTNVAHPDRDKLIAHDKSAIRATLGFQGDSYDATLMMEYEDREQSGSVYRAKVGNWLSDAIYSSVPGSRLASDIRDINSDQGLGEADNGEVLSLSAEINVDLGFATLTSLTGFKDHDYFYAEDYDGLPIAVNDYRQDQEGDYFEQELRLVSQSDSALSWYAGVSYYKENIDATFDQRIGEEVICQAYYDYTCADLFVYWEYDEFSPNPAGLIESNRTVGEYEGWGAYVDMTYAVNDKFELGVGLRYTKDTKDFSIDIFDVDSDLGPWYIFGVTTDGPASGKQSWDALTPRFVARFMPNDDWSLYASATRGYKAGGFASFAVLGEPDDDLVVSGGSPSSFDPETVWSYEIGAKGDLMDSRVRMDLSAYHYVYKDMQLNFFDQGSKVDNIGRVSAWGLEGSVQAILHENFNVYLAGSYNSHEVTEAEQIGRGDTLPGTPEWVFASVANYHVPVSDRGEFNASVELRSQTGTYGGLENFESARNAGWTDVSARLGYTDEGGWAITAYVENLFDKLYFDGTVEGGFPQPHTYFGPSRPRTFGVKLSYEFGD
jgi:iron complex outermembrane receptor protein